MRTTMHSALIAAALLVLPAAGSTQTRNGGATGTTGSTDAMQDVRHDLQQATQLATQMAKDQDTKRLLNRSKGVFLIPDYGRGAVVVGGAGGEGVLVPRLNGTWGNPVFYNLGSISVGAQVGATAGQLAMILMTDRAVNSFKGQNTFTLNADAGLTIVNWSGRSRASVGTADVVLWSDTEGAFAGASVGASNISADTDENQALYHKPQVSAGAILSGQVTTTDADVTKLHSAL